jgi:hypothetical protein
MATTTNFGWETPDDTDLVKDGALAMRTLGNSIDTSFVDLKGGTTGQNLRKNSNTDLDFTWAGDATNTVVDAAGDLLYGTAADTLGRLAIGTSGQVLSVSSGLPAWTTPAATTPTFSGARIYKSGSQILSNSTWTTVTFDSESFDTDAYHSTSTDTSRMTVPTGKSGYFLLIASFEFDANTTGRRIAPLWRKNGADAAYGNIYIANTGSVCSGSSSTILAGSAGDYFEFQVWQNSGGNLDLYGGDKSTSFQIQFLGA